MAKTTRSFVEENYEFFKSVLPGLIPLHANKFALIRDKKIIGFYSTMQDAYITGQNFYSDGRYSIQKVTDIPMDLGFFSHAVAFR